MPSHQISGNAPLGDPVSFTYGENLFRCIITWDEL